MIPEALLQPIRGARRILLSSHANPDGDAIGSELGLARILTSLGKQVTIWNLDACPGIYRQLPGAEGIHVGSEPPAGYPDEIDLGIVLECPSLDRTGLEARLRELPLLNIDHHLGNTGYGISSWVQVDAPAVGVMVSRLARALEAPLDHIAANCLYLALVTDTGGFRFANANASAFRAAAELIEGGAEVETVSRWLYESQPEGAVRLLGELLATLERHRRVVTVHLTLDAFTRAGAATGDSEGLVDVPRSIAGVTAVALFRELGPDLWKISLRSRGPVDVERIARGFGGGGHPNAAGCRFAGTIVEAKRRFVALLEEVVEASGAD